MSNGSRNPGGSATAAAIRVPLLYLCFFLSGIAGLIYQVVWSRYLTLFLGGTGQAQVIILGAFMGGLALGAWLLGRRADATPHPLKLYAMLELGIGLCGIVYPSLFDPIRSLFVALARALGLGPVGVNVAGIAVCALTVLLPTTLMGGTLPVLSRFMVENSTSVGRHVSRLYYLNSFGAVVGSLVGGMFLIPMLGLPFSMYAAAFLNLEVALVSWLLHAMLRGGATGEAARESAPAPAFEPDRASGPMTAARIALVVIGISGFVSFVYEVAWIRLLTTVLGTSSFSFSIMLSAFIAGITLGSFLLSRRRDEHGWFRVLGWCELGAGLSALLSIMVYQRLPYYLNQWRSVFANEDIAYPYFQAGSFLLCFIVMLVPTVFIGATVPAATRVVADEMRGLGHKIGSVFAINTAGTLVGALTAGFLLLPALGIRRTVEVAVGLNIALGLWVILADRTQPAPRLLRPAFAPVALLATLAAYLAFAPAWDQRVFTAATYRMKWRLASYEAFQEFIAARELVYYRDGKDASIAVTREHDEETREEVLTLRVNGKPDASTAQDTGTQILIGHLPMMLHPAPKDVLVVGLGSGMTAGAATAYPGANVTVVELIPEVVEAARHFGPWNNNVTSNPAVRLVVQDAKTFMQLDDATYDVIILEPTNPWIAGVAGLFSEEFLRDVRSRLRPGGTVLQWMHLYEMDDRAVWSVLRTFNEHFSYSTIFCIGVDMAIVGSTEPFEPDFARMEARAAEPSVAASLRVAHVEGILPLLSMQAVAKNDTPGPYVRMAWSNSDMYPLLEYVAVRGFFRRGFADSFKTLDRRGLTPGEGGLWLREYTPSVPPANEMFANWFHAKRKSRMMFDQYHLAWTDLWAKYHPGSPEMLLARASVMREDLAARARLLESPALADVPESLRERSRIAHAAYSKSTSFVHEADTASLMELHRRAADASPSQATEALFALGSVQLDSGHAEDAVATFGRALASVASEGPVRDSVRLRLAAAHASLGQLDRAESVLREIPEDGRGNFEVRNSRHFELCRILQERQRGEPPGDMSNPPIGWFE